MEHPRISEILANPAGTDRNSEWIELCAGHDAVALDAYALRIGTRQLTLSGTLAPAGCSIARTGTAAIRNREASVSLLYKGVVIQEAATAGTAPESSGFHIARTSSFWATSTPGNAEGTSPMIPPLPHLRPAPMLPGLLGTAACTAGILTALALFALRHARDRHHAREDRDTASRG